MHWKPCIQTWTPQFNRDTSTEYPMVWGEAGAIKVRSCHLIQNSYQSYVEELKFFKLLRAEQISTGRSSTEVNFSLARKNIPIVKSCPTRKVSESPVPEAFQKDLEN